MTLHIDKVYDLLRDLGVGEPLDDVASIIIDPHQVQVVRYLRDPDGNRYMVDDETGRHPAAEMTVIKIERP